MGDRFSGLFAGRAAPVERLDAALGRAAGSTVLPLVGRSAELGRVLAALERAAAGSGGALLLAGEAGIGKSRLAVEALTLARQRGFVTLEGAAYPLQTDLAYAPVLEMLGPFLAGLEPRRLATLVSGLPDLGRLFAGLQLPPPEPLGDAALERTRLFEAVSRLVERVAAERPVALLVDDLHWADATSLELLHYLARGLRARRVLLLGTYRLDEARTHPGLRALVRSLQRLGLAEELPVGGLGPEAVAALAGALLGSEPPAALLGALRERAAGMPLFVTALIRGLRDTGELFRSGGAWVLGSGSLSAVPPVVRDLVLARLERLEPADRALLELVAVAGDAAFSAILGRVGGPAAGELDAVLRRLCESGLVIEERSGTDLLYRAAHSLIAEVAAAVPADDDRAPAGRADAVAAARQSLATLDRLGARPLADRARQLLRALGERPAAPPRAVTGALSERELQVVRLVAAGLSNAEIAGRLFISPRTVTTHLQHVYARLGLPSRTALTRWVLERGLAAAEDT